MAAKRKVAITLDDEPASVAWHEPDVILALDAEAFSALAGPDSVP